MSILKRLVAGILAVAAIFTISACNVKNAMSIGDEQIPAGVYIYYVNSAYSELTGYATEAEYTGDIWDFTYEDMSAQDWINKRAEQLCVQLVAVERKFNELGLTLSEEDKASLDSYVTYYWDYYGYGESMEYSGISKDSYARVLRQSTYANKILLNMYGVGGSEEIKVDDLKATMEKDYYRTQVIYISSVDDEGNEYVETSKEYIENEKIAKRIYKTLDPEGFAELEKEEEKEESNTTSSDATSSDATSSQPTSSEAVSSTESTVSEATQSTESATENADGEEETEEPEAELPNDFIQLMKDYSDSYTAPKEDATEEEKKEAEEALLKGEVKSYENSSYSSDVVDMIKELEEGKIGFVKDKKGWYIVKKLNMFADEKVVIDDYRDELIISLKEETYTNELLAAWEKTLRENNAVSVDSGALSKYSGKKIEKRNKQYDDMVSAAAAQ